jgi:hypothetical protein
MYSFLFHYFNKSLLSDSLSVLCASKGSSGCPEGTTATARLLTSNPCGLFGVATTPYLDLATPLHPAATLHKVFVFLQTGPTSFLHAWSTTQQQQLINKKKLNRVQKVIFGQ